MLNYLTAEATLKCEVSIDFGYSCLSLTQGKILTYGYFGCLVYGCVERDYYLQRNSFTLRLCVYIIAL